MDLFSWALEHELRSLCKNDVSLRMIGDMSRFSPKLQQAIKDAEDATRDNKGLVLNIAVNYGGRWDIARGCFGKSNLFYNSGAGFLPQCCCDFGLKRRGEY